MPAADEQSHDLTLRELLDRLPARRLLLSLAAAVFIASRLWWYAEFGSEYQERFNAFFGYAAHRGIDLGKTVYRDFDFEYPPLAWWLSALPRLAESERYPKENVTFEEMIRFRTNYFHAFHVELFLIDLACFALMFGIGRQLSRRAEWLLPTAYSVMTIAQPQLIFDSLDLALCAFFLAASFCWLRSIGPGRAAARWALAAYALLGLGVGLKIFPVFFAPFWLLADWRAATKKQWFARAAVFALAAGAPFALYYAIAGPGVFTLFKYHAERGIQFESPWGSLMMLDSRFGRPCAAVHSHGSFDLVGYGDGAFKAAASLLSIAMPGVLWIWAAWKKIDRRAALDAAIACLLAAVAVSRVYSPQYALWYLPLAMIGGVGLFAGRWPAWLVFTVLAATILGASAWIWPDHFQELSRLEQPAVAVALARSACFVGLALLLASHFARLPRGGQQPY